MKKTLNIFVVFINLLCISYSQSVFETLNDKFSKNDELSVVNRYLSSSNTIGIVNRYLSSSNTIGIVDIFLNNGKTIYLTDSYIPKVGDEEKVFQFVDKGYLSSSNTIGIVNRYLSSSNTIGIVNMYLSSENTYNFTNNPSLSDIIIVMDIDLILDIFEDMSIIDIILENFNGKTKIKKTTISKISDNYPHNISLSDGTVYFTIDLDPILWLEYSSVYVIGDKYLIYRPLNDKINVTKVR